MRWLIRSMLFWAISLPIFYIFILPYLLTKLQTKSQTETYAQCQRQLVTQHMAGTEGAMLNAAESDHYCHCISDRLTIERADLPELVQHKEPARLTESMKNIVDSCNVELQQTISKIIDAPPARTTTDANGVETVYFK